MHTIRISGAAPSPDRPGTIFTTAVTYNVKVKHKGR
jgi:hypothetical protein